MADAADEAATGTAAAPPVAAPLGHYARLQEIEERVVRAIEAAGFAMGELAKERADIDKALLNAAVKGFLEQLQVKLRHLPVCSTLTSRHTHRSSQTPYCAVLAVLSVDPCRRRSSLCWRQSRLLPLTETLRPTTTSSCCRSVRVWRHMHITLALAHTTGQAAHHADPDVCCVAPHEYMLQAMAAAEKLDAMSVHISGISKVLREHQQQQQQQQPTGGPQGATPAQPDGAS
jgi:hypothetical protein